MASSLCVLALIIPALGATIPMRGTTPPGVGATARALATTPPNSSTIRALATTIPSLAPSSGQQSAFGFAVGEERRYVLGPPEALRIGEREEWRIRLESFDDDAAGVITVFSFSYRSELPAVVEGTTESFEVEGRVHLNEHAFPMMLEFTEQEGVGGARPWLGEIRTTLYTFADGRYEKRSRVEELEWTRDIPIAGHAGLDRELPAGMYLFAPRLAGFRTNPGFLDILLQQPGTEIAGKRDVLLFVPAGTPRYQGRYGDRSPLGIIRNYYAHSHVELVGRERMRWGDRTLDARKLDIGGPLGDAYLDDLGEVVRIDLGRDNILNADRWIRRLHPTEY